MNRLKLDREDARVLAPLVGLAFVVLGVLLLSVAAALITAGVGYLALGVYRKWF